MQVSKVTIDPQDYPPPIYNLTKKKIRYNRIGLTDDYIGKRNLLKQAKINIEPNIKIFLQWKPRTDNLPSIFNDHFSSSGIHTILLDKSGIQLQYSNDGDLILLDIKIIPKSNADNTFRYNHAMRSI